MSNIHPFKVFVLLLGLVTVLSSLAFLPEGSLGTTLGLVVLLGLVCSASTIIDRLSGRFDTFELIHLVCYLSFLYYGAGSLYVLFDPRAAYDSRVYPYLGISLVYCILGVASMIYGYYLARRFGSTRSTIRTEVQGTIWIAALFGVGTLGQFAGLIAERQTMQAASVGGLVSLLQQLQFLALFAYFLLFVLFFKNKATLQQKMMLFFVVVPVELLFAYVRLGAKAFTLTILGLPIVAYYYVHRRMPAKSLVALVFVGVFVVFPFYNNYRIVSPNYSMGVRIEKTVDRLMGHTTGSYAEESFFQVGKRMSLINSVAVVVRETGRSVEYEYGRTIALTAMSLAIPRVFWPDKPSISLGREFGRKFRILPRWDRRTYVSVTPVGEWYWNFGVPGVILGMFLMGVALQAAYRFLGQAGAHNEIRIAMYGSLLPRVMSFETNIAAWVGTTTRALLIFMALLWFLREFGAYRVLRDGADEEDVPQVAEAPEAAPVGA